MKLSPIFALVLTVLSASAWSVNKCTGPDGATVFQDMPCAGKGEQVNIRPAAGHAASPVNTDPDTRQVTEAERIEKQIADSQRGRRKQDLQERLVPNAKAMLQQHRRGCEQKQASLSGSQYEYKQNLYGKIHAAQVASEMAASAAACDMKERELKSTLDSLLSECAALGGCK